MGDDRPVLTLAHSPDSDDMVMWWPLTGMLGPDGVRVAGADGAPAIETGGFRFACRAEDIEALNRESMGAGEFDITAISAGAYPGVADRYAITACGASLGDGYGPKVVVRPDDERSDLAALAASDAVFAIPGVHTSAFLALRLLAGRSDLRHRPMHFMEVIGAVAGGDCDAGVLIHEAQLNAESDGVRVVGDLGALWGAKTGLMLPLGLNVVRRDLDERFGAGSCDAVARTLASSVRHAMDHPAASKRFLRMHASGRPEWHDDDLLDRYLAMYVNETTVDLGSAGRRALDRFLSDGASAGLCGGIPAGIRLAGGVSD